MFNKRCRACNTILTQEEIDSDMSYCSGCIETINVDLDTIYKEEMEEETFLFQDGIMNECSFS